MTEITGEESDLNTDRGGVHPYQTPLHNEAAEIKGQEEETIKGQHLEIALQTSEVDTGKADLPQLKEGKTVFMRETEEEIMIMLGGQGHQIKETGEVIRQIQEGRRGQDVLVHPPLMGVGLHLEDTGLGHQKEVKGQVGDLCHHRGTGETTTPPGKGGQVPEMNTEDQDHVMEEGEGPPNCLFLEIPILG